MRVLVTAASRHGATRGIAHAIADQLAEAGHEVTFGPVEEMSGVDDHDAVVIGSAIYAGHWLDPARDLVATHTEHLRQRPVWLFSSGPLGNPPKPEEDAVDVASLMEQSGAREHRVFPGRLERSRLGFRERAMVMALRAPEGDFRDWKEIRAWAAGIAEALGQEAPAPGA